MDVSQILHSSKSIDPGGVSEEGDHPFSKLVNIYTPPIFFIPKAILFFNKVQVRLVFSTLVFSESGSGSGSPGGCGEVTRDLSVVVVGRMVSGGCGLLT